MAELPAMQIGPNPNEVSLKEYTDTRLHALEDFTDTRLAALEKQIAASLKAQEVAILKAETATEKRFESVNEFRSTLTDQAGTFATKPALDALAVTLASKIDAMRESVDAKIEALRISHDTEIKGLSKQVYIISGALAAIQVLLQFIPR